MFQDKTVENLHNELLQNIDNSYQKTVGYLAYDMTRSFSIQEAKLYLMLQLLFNKVDVDNLTGDELTKYVKQRKGIIRKLATYSNTSLDVIGNGEIKIGDLFETKIGIQFKSLENKVINGTGIINVQALISGSTGMVGPNEIIQMPITIPGITSVTNKSVTLGGYDEESDDSLRGRYYEALRKPPTSGNKHHYSIWAKEVTGVGDAKIYPLWNGDKTVKVVIIDSNKCPANSDLVIAVQNYIDPKGIYNPVTETWSTWGTGSGEAPLGAYCTVESATAKEITIKVKVTKDTTYKDEDIKNNISNNIKKYFKEVAFREDSYISYAKIGNLVITANGVSDYYGLLVNDAVGNISFSLTSKLTEIPVLKDVIFL